MLCCQWCQAWQTHSDMSPPFGAYCAQDALVAAAKEIPATYLRENPANATQAHLGADDFFPIFIYVLMQSGIRELAKLKCLLSTLCDPGKVRSTPHCRPFSTALFCLCPKKLHLPLDSAVCVRACAWYNGEWCCSGSPRRATTWQRSRPPSSTSKPCSPGRAERNESPWGWGLGMCLHCLAPFFVGLRWKERAADDGDSDRRKALQCDNMPKKKKARARVAVVGPCFSSC